MTPGVPCPLASGPPECYAARFHELFGSLAQQREFRELPGRAAAPRDRNKTLTALAGAESVAGAQLPSVQRLQLFCPISVGSGYDNYGTYKTPTIQDWLASIFRAPDLVA